MKGTYSADMKNGIFIYYSDHNTYESAGRYEKELPIGKWENSHWNGALQSEVFYGDETFTGTVWDSLGNPQVINGNGKSIQWYASGQVAEEGNYRNGRKEGMWYGFHQDGKPYYKEQYRDNRLVHGVSEGKDGRRYVYDHLSEFPFPRNGMPAFKTYLENYKEATNKTFQRKSKDRFYRRYGWRYLELCGDTKHFTVLRPGSHTINKGRSSLEGSPASRAGENYITRLYRSKFLDISTLYE